jgi:anaerobic magnesium-protoporphyrin IX monomethyl ester cyclase
MSEGDNYLLPQGLACLAAVLRAEGHEVRVLDCLPLRMGWQSLARALREARPDIVGCGENHALYVDEALKFFRLCREVVPEARRIAGGAHFTNLPRRYLEGPPSDEVGDIEAIVIGEGERSFAALCEELAASRPDLGRVRGIAWREGERCVLNPARPLIEDLDALPLPAYDLMPMPLYGTSRFLFSPGGTTIHHSRGCTSRCSFCAWWTTMAERRTREDGSQELQPRWRTRSAERVMEEVECLYYRHGKRSLVWVDESWNIDPGFESDFADLLLRKRMNLTWFAFMRADGVVRDERLGILEKLVRAGLAHVLIGVERLEDESLDAFGKPFYKGGVAGEALRIFKTRYPQVFLQGTFIVGVREETRASLKRQEDFAASLDIDFPAFHPLTPVPGTSLYEEALREGWIDASNFEAFDWLTPIMDTRHLTRDEIAMALYEMNERFVNPRWLLRGLASRVPYKRDMYVWFTKVSLRLALSALKERLNPFSVESYQRLVTPDWYEG